MSLETIGDHPTCFFPIATDMEVMAAYHSPFNVRFPRGLKVFGISAPRTLLEVVGTNAYMGLDWDGSVADHFYELETLRFDSENYPRFGHALARGLYHLGLLSSEVEAALNVSISEHEKLEWRLEYEARNDL